METKIYRVGALDVARIERLLVRFALAGLVVGMLLATIITTVVFTVMYNTAKAYYEDEITSYTTQISTLVATHANEMESMETAHQNSLRAYEERAEGFDDEVSALNSRIQDLETEVLRLTSEQTLEMDQIRNFLYVIEDTPKNSGLTLDHIKWSIECCETWNVNPQLMWAIYWVESSFDPRLDSSKSSARGLGQALESTARDIWENVLGHGAGSYTHTMAYDPYVNIEITTCLLGRNLANQSLEDAVWLYGDRTDTYFGKVIQAAANHGYTIDESNARYT